MFTLLPLIPTMFLSFLRKKPTESPKKSTKSSNVLIDDNELKFAVYGD